MADTVAQSATRGRARTVLSGGVFLGVAVLTTTAFFTDFAHLETRVDGSNNRFDLVVAGSIDPTWVPAPNDWVQANDEAVIIDIGENTHLSPGETRRVKLAVKNQSPRLSGDVALEFRDPDPLGTAIDPVTGQYLELFDQLEFAVIEQGETVFRAGGAAPQAERTYTWDGPLAAGEQKEIEVAVTLLSTTDNRWQTAGTQVQFSFMGVNSVA